MQSKLLFIAIIVLAGLLRFTNLDKYPPSLNWDEVSLGYNSYSILKTGKDEWGEFLPLSFRAFGDYKLPGYVYLDVPSIATIGLNEWGVRFPSAILGLGFVILIILILKNLTNNRVALWGGFLSAILPWAIIVSRIALEAHLSLVLTTLGVYLFLLGLKNKMYLIFSGLAFGLTLFSYNGSRVVTPILVFILATFYFKDLVKIKKISVVALAIFLLISSIALPKALLQDSTARYRWTTIYDEGAINKINEQRRISTLPENFKRIVFNKVTFFITESSKNYIVHFNPDFLFFNGGSNYQFSVPGSGLLYISLVPFLLLGFWQALKERKKGQLLFLAWLLIAPIPAAITRDAPHALRSLTMIPPLVFLGSLGIEKFIGYFKKWSKPIIILILILLTFSLYGFVKNYTGNYVKNYSWSWQYGYREVLDYINSEGNNYNKIYFTKKYGEPHEFVLFYSKTDPEKYRNDPNLNRYFMSDWYWVDSFDKFIFVNDWEIKSNVICNEKCLLVTSPGNYSGNSKLLKEINFLNGDKAFDIVELNKP